jgi:hypothetical protein
MSQYADLYSMPEEQPLPPATAPFSDKHKCVVCGDELFFEFRYACTHWAHNDCVGGLKDLERDDAGAISDGISCPRCRQGKVDTNFKIPFALNDTRIQWLKRCWLLNVNPVNFAKVLTSFHKSATLDELQERGIRLEDIFKQQINFAQLAYFTKETELQNFVTFGLKPKHLTSKKYAPFIHINEVLSVCSLNWKKLQNGFQDVFKIELKDLPKMDANFDTFKLLGLSAYDLLEQNVNLRQFKMKKGEWKQLGITSSVAFSLNLSDLVTDAEKNKSGRTTAKKSLRK